MIRPISGRPTSIPRTLLIVALGPWGCARDRGQITPTTLGTDLRAMPRGKMIPLPFPGSSLARGEARPIPGGPTLDQEAATASAEAGRWPAPPGRLEGLARSRRSGDDNSEPTP